MASRVEIAITATGAEEVSAAFRRIGQQVEGFGGSLRRVFEIASGFSLANIFETGVRAIVDTTRELVRLGLEVQRQEDAFKRLTASVGVSGADLQARLAAASRGIADISDVMTTAGRALQEGLQTDQLVTLMTIATEQSKLMGTTVAQAFNDITEAILRQQERGLKSAGIYVDATDALNAYAAKLGTTTERLTEAHKTQAFFDAAVAKSQKTVEAMSSSMLTNSQAVEKFHTTIKNISADMGVGLVDALANSVRWLGAVGEGVAVLTAKYAALKAVVDQLKPSMIFGALPFIGGAIPSRPSSAGASGSWEELAGKGLPPPALKPPDPKELQKATDAVAAFRQKLVELATVDETAKALLNIRQEVTKLSTEFPALAPQIAAIGAALEATTIAIKAQAQALKDAEAAWKETDAILDIMDTGLLELKAPLQASGDLATRFALAGDDVKFSLGGATTAVLTFREAFPALNRDMEFFVPLLEQLGPVLTDDRKAFLDFQESMRVAGVNAQLFGSGFDIAGARIAALRSQLDALVRTSRDGVTPEMQQLGDELRMALADQSLYSSIQSGFLSITDTFTKMADGLIAGTLDIADAFKNLGQSLLTNFVQLVLHQVFDPVLKEAASFVSGLIGLLTGRGGLVTAGASAFGGLLLKLTGSASAGGASGEEAFALASSATAQGGGSTIGTLSTIGGALTSAYNYIVAPLAKLPTLLTLAGDALTYLGSASSAIVAGIQTGTLSIPAAFGGAAAGGAGAGTAAGATTGALAGITVGAGAGIGIAFAIPALAGFLDGLGRAQIAANNFARASAQASLASDQAVRLAQFQAGILDTTNQAFRTDLAAAIANYESSVGQFKAGGSLVNAPTAEGTEQVADAMAQAFVDAVEALGIEPLQGGIDIGQGGRGGFGGGMLASFYAPALAQLQGAQPGGGGGAPAFDRAGLITQLLGGDLAQIALLLDLPGLAREGEAAGDTLARMVTALRGLGDLMDTLSQKSAALQGNLDIPTVLAANLADMVAAIDRANVAFATTQDPEKQLAAAQELSDLIERRYQLEIDAVRTLTGILETQAGSISTALQALATAAPVLRELGIRGPSAVEALSSVLDVLQGVGDVAGAVSGSQGLLASLAGEIEGAAPPAILHAAQVVSESLSRSVNLALKLPDAQQRLAALGTLLGDVTQGFQAATQALTAYYDKQRAEEQALFEARRDALQMEIDDSTAIVKAYFDHQRTALQALVVTSRQWEASVRRIRDQILNLQTSEISPLNPADQLAIAQAQLGEALARFWVNPAADVADEVSALAGRVLDVGSTVFSRPSPEFAALFDNMTSILEQVAGAAQGGVTPEAQMVDILNGINAAESAMLVQLGSITTANQAAVEYLGGRLSTQDLGVLQQMGFLSEAQVETIKALGGTLTTEDFKALAELGHIGDASAITAGSIQGLSEAGQLSLQALGQNLQVGLAARDELAALNTDHAAKLDAIAKEEQISRAYLNEWFGDLASRTTGVARSVDGLASDAKFTAYWTWFAANENADANTKLGGIWGAIGDVRKAMEATRDQIGTLTYGTPLDQFIADRTWQMAQDLSKLHDSIHDSLRDLVGSRIDTLIAQGGPQAVADALKGPLQDTATNTYMALSWLESLVKGTFMGGTPYKPYQTGTWNAPGGPGLLHPGEIVVPMGKSAAQWMREGGFLGAGRDQGSVSVTFGPGAIVVQGADQPEAVARRVVKEFERSLLDKGVKLYNGGR